MKKEFIYSRGLLGEQGTLMVHCEPYVINSKLRYYLFCYDTQYKDKIGNILILSDCDIGLGQMLFNDKGIKKIKDKLKVQAEKYIKKNYDKHN